MRCFGRGVSQQRNGCFALTGSAECHPASLSILFLPLGMPLQTKIFWTSSDSKDFWWPAFAQPNRRLKSVSASLNQRWYGDASVSYPPTSSLSQPTRTVHDRVWNAYSSTHLSGATICIDMHHFNMYFVHPRDCKSVCLYLRILTKMGSAWIYAFWHSAVWSKSSEPFIYRPKQAVRLSGSDVVRRKTLKMQKGQKGGRIQPGQDPVNAVSCHFQTGVRQAVVLLQALKQSFVSIGSVAPIKSPPSCWAQPNP